jgi:hypothetical protein
VDIICCICDTKYGEKKGEGKSHGICPDCTPQYMRDQGFNEQDITECMEKWHGSQQ